MTLKDLKLTPHTLIYLYFSNISRICTKLAFLKPFYWISQHILPWGKSNLLGRAFFISPTAKHLESLQISPSYRVSPTCSSLTAPHTFCVQFKTHFRLLWKHCDATEQHTRQSKANSTAIYDYFTARIFANINKGPTSGTAKSISIVNTKSQTGKSTETKKKQKTMKNKKRNEANTKTHRQIIIKVFSNIPRTTTKKKKTNTKKTRKLSSKKSLSGWFLSSS